jgi:hypothetical protein
MYIKLTRGRAVDDFKDGADAVAYLAWRMLR